MANAYLSITLTQGTQSVANNTTVVTAQVYYHGNGVSWSNYNCKVTLTLDGTTYSGTHTFTTSSSAQLILTATKTVTHATNGTKTVSASASFATGVSIGTLTASASKTLTTIPRASQPTLSSSSVTYGNSVTIYTNSASSTFTHTLQYGASGHVSWTTLATGVGTSHAWTVPASLAQYFPSSGDRVIYIKCITYSGSTKIGEAISAGLTLNRAGTMVPTIATFSITDAEGLYARYGAYVQGKSRYTVSLGGALSYKSPIASAKLTANGATKTATATNGSTTYTTAALTSGFITDTGGSITATVTDQRGGSATRTETVTVLPYQSPTISKYEVNRCTDASGTEIDDEGAFARIDYKVEVSPLDNQNSKALVLKYRQHGAADWTSQSVTLSSYTQEDFVVVPCDTEHTYELMLELTDDFATAQSAVAELGTAFTLLDFHNSGTGMAIGKVAETQSLLEVDLAAQFNGDVVLDHDPANAMEAATKQYVDGASYMGDFVVEQGTTTDNAWRYVKWNSGKLELFTATSRQTSVALTSKKADGVYTNGTWAARDFLLPSGMATHVYYANATVTSTGYTLCQVSGLSTTSATVRVWGSYSQTITMTVFVHVIGAWK